MIRYQCLELLAANITDQLLVTSQSGQRIEWSHLSKHEGNLLVGMMGCAIGVGMGLALALPHRKVIVLDSDGSVLLSVSSLVPPGAVPTTLVVDKQGRVASRVLGEIQKGTLKALIESAVAE